MLKRFIQVLFCLWLTLHSSLVSATSNDETTPLDSKNNSFEFLPQKELFIPLAADVRESLFSIRYERQEIEDSRFSAASVSFGDYLPLFNYSLSNNSTLQVSFDGAMHALFNLDTPSYNLVNTDYLVGPSLSLQNDNLTTRVRLYHASGHLGDEFILENPDFERRNSSYEDLELISAYTQDLLRVYAGGGYIVRTNSFTNNKPFHARSGVELRLPIKSTTSSFLFALDLESQERTNWHISTSFVGGISTEKNFREIRFLGGYFNGKSPHGQFFLETIEYWGFGVYFLV